MRIRWFGHSFFQITAADGRRIITDPFDDSLGYDVPDVSSDVVTVSHDHYDHNAVKVVGGAPTVLKGPGRHRAAGFTFIGIPSFHDRFKGARRGSNTIFTFTVDGVKLVHLGDLGEVPDTTTIKEIGEVDILFIPVGGTYTVDGDEATRVIELLKPRVAIPMHYKTPAISLPIEGVERFLKGKDRVERVSHVWDLVAEDLRGYDGGVVVMDYS